MEKKKELEEDERKLNSNEKVENKYTLAYLAKYAENSQHALDKLKKSALIYHKVILDNKKIEKLEVNP
jgi:hypothetical protein